MGYTEQQLASFVASDPRRILREIEHLEERERCEDSFLEFVKAGWSSLEPGTPLTIGWSIEAMCLHLEAVSKGDIRHLLCNVPPGALKSMLFNVFFPAWEWGPRRKPEYRYISASYEQGLATRDLVRCRDLINSEWYQSHWGRVFSWKKDQNQKTYYENDRQGWRQSASSGSALTGYRGDRIIVDDPHSVQSAESEARREETLRWFTETVPTRLNKPSESCILVVMQRLNERDVSGLILANGLNYEHLMIPMEFEPERKCYTSIGWEDPRKEDGELMFPERFSKESVEELKLSFRSKGGAYAEAGQLQQRPIPRGGGMFKRADFTILDSMPKTKGKAVRGWDLAASSGKGDYSVGAKIYEMDGGGICIADIVRGQWSASEVRRQLKTCAEQDGEFLCRQSIPQDPGQAGKAQKSDLALLLGGYDVKFSLESGDKITRAQPLESQVQNGHVYLLRGNWNDAFLNEICSFPNAQYDDQVDAVSRAYNELKKMTNVPKVEFFVGMTRLQEF